VTIVGFVAMGCIAAALAWPLRGTTLWPIALPIALAFGEAGFVQTWDLQVNVSWFPVPFHWLDIVFGALVVAWLLVRRLSSSGSALPVSAGLDVGVLTAWLVMVAIAVPLAWIDGGAVKLGILWTALPYAYIPLSCILIYDILRRTNRAAMWALLQSLSVVTSVLAVFYILHMLGWSVYDAAGVNSTYSNVAGVRRDILTFPIWSCVTVPFLLWSERIRVAQGVMIVLQVAAVAVSVTRSLVLSCVFAIVLLVALRVIAVRRPLQPLVPLSVGAVALGASALFVPGLVSRTVGSLLSRFGELSGGVGSVTNVASRLNVTERVSSFLHGWTLWTGAGFSDAAVAQSQTNMGHLLVADSLWSLVLLGLGLLGAAAVAVALTVGLWSGIVATFRQRAEPLALGAVGAAALLWLIARTPASSEILITYPIVCAFALALVMVEVRSAWSTSSEALKLVFGREAAPVLPDWLPNDARFKAALVVLAVVAEVAIGRAIAR
jgi:hypothetical protein